MLKTNGYNYVVIIQKKGDKPRYLSLYKNGKNLGIAFLKDLQQCEDSVEHYIQKHNLNPEDIDWGAFLMLPNYPAKLEEEN